MLAGNDMLSIVDLGNDHFIVSFPRDIGHDSALVEGPWMIYEHYLTVRE